MSFNMTVHKLTDLSISFPNHQNQCTEGFSSITFVSFISTCSQCYHEQFNKTADLSQRRPRDAPNMWVHWKVLRVLTKHPTTFPEICNGLLFRSTLRMCVQNLKFVALPVSEIIGGSQKIWAVPGYAHAPFSPKNFKGLLFGWTLWIHLPNLKFVALPLPEIIGGTQKIWAVPVYAHAPFSPKFLKGFCSHGPCEYTCQVWSLSLYPFLR